MSKFFPIIVCAIFLQLVEFEVSGQSWNFGVQASSILSKQRFVIEPPNQDEIIDAYGPLWSYSVNAFVSRKVTEKWFVSLEPGFIRKGELALYDRDDPSDDVKLIFDYTQLLILGHYSILDNFFVSFGPELSYLHRVNAKSAKLENDISKFYDKNFDFSGIVGVGISILKFIDIEIRYNHSITSYQEMPLTNIDGDVLATITRYNQYAQLLLRFKKKPARGSGI